MTPDEKTAKIRRLNDMLRAGHIGGTVAFVGALAEAPVQEQIMAAGRVHEYSTWNDGNDPFGEHDFGSFDIDGQKYFWKIDYYNLDCDGHSPDPSNPDVTRRVLTIFYAEDY